MKQRPPVGRRQVLRFGAGLTTGLAIAATSGRLWPALATPRAGQPFPSAAGAESGGRLVVPAVRADGALLSPEVSSGQVYQGGALRIAVPGATTATARLLGREFAFVETSRGLATYIGIGILDPPGQATLAIDAVDPILGPVLLERPITVLPTNWTVDYITVPPGTGTEDNEDEADYLERVRQEIQLLSATYARETGRAWDEPWLPPINAPISGYFGEQRSFNGGPVGGHHGGTDFGAQAGTPVSSTNAGLVVVARKLATRGNFVIVDHGSGILTGYAHLSAFEVAEGQVVGKGQPVGKVGSTGLSTGPHLHWELSVHGILVDGLRWLDGSQGF